MNKDPTVEATDQHHADEAENMSEIELRQEVERLRAWLDQIRYLMVNAYGNSSFHPHVAGMAKAALSGEAPPPDRPDVLL